MQSFPNQILFNGQFWDNVFAESCSPYFDTPETDFQKGTAIPIIN
jgi:hypothetical protein